MSKESKTPPPETHLSGIEAERVRLWNENRDIRASLDVEKAVTESMRLERDAMLKALQSIASPRDCGCNPSCQCGTQESLEIEAEALRYIAKDAISNDFTHTPLSQSKRIFCAMLSTGACDLPERLAKAEEERDIAVAALNPPPQPMRITSDVAENRVDMKICWPPSGAMEALIEALKLFIRAEKQARDGFPPPDADALIEIGEAALAKADTPSPQLREVSP